MRSSGWNDTIGSECRHISTNTTNKWAALQWLSCFQTHFITNASFLIILSMCWAALTVKVHYFRLSILVHILFCIRPLKLVLQPKIGKGCVFTYDAVGSYERVGYSSQGSGSTLIMPFLDNQLKSPSPLLLPAQVKS